MEKNDRSILKKEYQATSSVQKPYKWQHFDPDFINTAINNIWKSGSANARKFYDIGHDMKQKNWVIKWLLWHVCRYRDWRNRKTRSTLSRPISKLPEQSPWMKQYLLKTYRT